MGRSGGGGGGHSSGGHGGGSHHSISHHSSSSRSSFSSSSFHGGPGNGGRRPSPPPRSYNPGPRYRSYGPRYRDYGPGMPPPPPRASYRHSSGVGCLSYLFTIIFALLLIVILAVASNSSGSSVNDSKLTQYAEQQAKALFDGREDYLIILIDENDDGQLYYGTKANPIMDNYGGLMWDSYDRNYQDDLGLQMKATFIETANAIIADGVTPIKSDKAFETHCYRDDLNWVDTKGNLQDGAQAFYDATGIQPYVMFVKAKTIANATNKSSGVLKVLIICASGVIVLAIGFTWWKKKIAQKNKEQEDLERTLNIPLESFGSESISDLEKKYDDTTTQ